MDTLRIIEYDSIHMELKMNKINYIFRHKSKCGKIVKKQKEVTFTKIRMVVSSGMIVVWWIEKEASGGEGNVLVLDLFSDYMGVYLIVMH